MGSSDICAYPGCGRASYHAPGHPTSQFCVLHAESKDITQFYAEFGAELQRQRNKGEYSFVGYVFPHNVAEQLDEIPRDHRPFFGRSFDRKLVLTNVVFQGEVDFRQTTFQADAEFVSVRFQGGANFERASFKEKAKFEGMEVSGTVDMTYCSFAVLGDWSGCVIRRKVQLKWPGPGLKRRLSGDQVTRGTLQLYSLDLRDGILDLRDNSLAEDCEIVIRDCDLSCILLAGTDCTRLRFQNIHFSGFIWGRPVIGDEWVPRRLHRNEYGKAQLHWHKIAITYQELAKNAHERFSHALANAYTRGVFAMRRMAIPNQSAIGRWLWGSTSQDPPTAMGRLWTRVRRGSLMFVKNVASLPALFFYVSLYGGSVLLPFLWVLFLTALFGGFYELLMYGGWPSLRDWVWPVSGWVAALRIVGLNRAWLVDEVRGSPNELLVTVLANLQVVITAVVVALLLFAVRRRFKYGD